MKLLPTQIDRRDWSMLRAGGFHREYMSPPRPLVITGGFDDWRARRKWTPEFFRSNHGSRIVEVDKQRWRLADLLDRILRSTPEEPAPYLRNELLSRWPPELLADISPLPQCTRPNWLESRAMPSSQPLTSVELYIGGAGSRFPVLHYDGLHTHAYLMQLYGEKEYFALAPDQAAYVYPQKGFAANKSSVDDVEHPDLERFPLFARAEAIRFRLGPGETLFVPAGWWHTARILSTSITVSVNGANRANWSAFSKDFVIDRAHTSRRRAALLKPYLGVLGLMLALSTDPC